MRCRTNYSNGWWRSNCSRRQLGHCGLRLWRPTMPRLRQWRLKEQRKLLNGEHRGEGREGFGCETFCQTGPSVWTWDWNEKQRKPGTMTTLNTRESNAESREQASHQIRTHNWKLITMDQFGLQFKSIDTPTSGYVEAETLWIKVYSPFFPFRFFLGQIEAQYSPTDRFNIIRASNCMDMTCKWSIRQVSKNLIALLFFYHLLSPLTIPSIAVPWLRFLYTWRLIKKHSVVIKLHHKQLNAPNRTC